MDLLNYGYGTLYTHRAGWRGTCAGGAVDGGRVTAQSSEASGAGRVQAVCEHVAAGHVSSVDDVCDGGESGEAWDL